ncbi:hypothetical protein DB346_19830 [Verrucomicrobia bacterium LW23]|nr:hypothetical protein DB346_19830 [Verrucomicrobia bacterium LW23]
MPQPSSSAQPILPPRALFAGGGAAPEGRAWAARLHRRDAEALWSLRLFAGLDAGVAGEFVWVRGAAWSTALGEALAGHPSAQWYEVLAGGKLRDFSRLLPDGRLPHVTWQPLAQALEIAPPSTLMPGRLPDPRRRSATAVEGSEAHPGTTQSSALVELTLVRSATESEPGLLIVAEGPWRAFVEEASEVRFGGLVFAVAGDGSVCVAQSGAGTAVLPSLPGVRYCVSNGIAVPCGWTWAPALPSEIVRRALWRQRPPPMHAPGSGDRPELSAAAGKVPTPAVDGWLYLWHADKMPQWVAEAEILPLSRSAARFSYTRA